MSSSLETWNALADTYDAERDSDPSYLRCIEPACTAINRARPTRVLDAGCGTGLTTLPVCRDGRTVVAADYSLQSLRCLKHKHVVRQITSADICALPFRSGYFSAVLCANALQHLSPDRQPAAVGELLRVLRPGGTLVLTVHHYSREKQRRGWIKEGKPGQLGVDYIYRFSTSELRRMLPHASIAAIGMSTRIDRLLPWFVRPLLARLGCGHMLMAVVRRGRAG